MIKYMPIAVLLAVTTVAVVGCGEATDATSAAQTATARGTGGSEAAAEVAYGLAMTVDGQRIEYQPAFQMRPIVGTITNDNTRVSIQDTTSLASARKPGDQQAVEYGIVINGVTPGEYKLVPSDKYEGFPTSPEPGDKIASVIIYATGQPGGEEVTFPADLISQTGTLTVKAIEAQDNPNSTMFRDVKSIHFIFGGSFEDADGQAVAITEGIYRDIAKDRK